MGELAQLEVDGDTGVATIRLDRPPMNALSRQLWRDIEECAQNATADDDVGAIVVWGGPDVFAAGADIEEFPDWDYQQVNELGGLLQRSLATLADSPKISIAAVNGYALGGGCELAMACDLRFVSEEAQLGQPEILLGLIPGAGGTQRLPRLVGLSRAKELIFSGRRVGAEEALDIGLADTVLPPDEVYEGAVDRAADLAAGPYALRLAKRAIDDGTEMSLEQGLRLERSLFAECFTTEDAATGIASFLEEGPGRAEFSGR